MGDVVQVEPKPESYILEWRAAQVDRSDMGGISKLLRPLGASVFADLADESGGVVVALRSGSALRASATDWIVISPHDKVMVIDDFTFCLEFRAL